MHLFDSRWIHRTALVIGCVASLGNAIAADCPRSYVLPEPGKTKTHQIRLVDQHWQIGVVDSSHEWQALSCSPNLGVSFFDPTNIQAQDEEGTGHVGLSASVLFYPSEKVPEGVRFVTNPQDLFGMDRITIPLPGAGRIYIDKKKYEQFHTVINGVNVEIDSEPTNPAKDAAIKTLTIYTRLFPHRALAMSKHRKTTIALLLNKTEGFQAKPIRPNGLHNPKYLYSVLFSQDGTHVLSHSFHEIGGLFRISKNKYAQGLTWTIAYDLLEKLAESPEEKLKQKCIDLDNVVFSLKATAQNGNGDFSHSVEYYVDDVFARSGWPMYAWGSAFYWKKINSVLEASKLPTMYKLIDTIHQYGWRSINGSHDLDKLLAAYLRVSPEGYSTFNDLVTRYFRQQNLGQLLSGAVDDQKKLGCQTD